jgi:chaperonin GroEL (HSP60 family)
VPPRQIAQNSGTDGSIVVGKLLESKTTTHGYDARKDEFTDMIKAGIISTRPRSCGTLCRTRRRWRAS